MMITIREERPEDIATVRAINEAAFERATEASIVDTLRTACPSSLSFVAQEGNRVVGHILFSPVIVSDETGPVEGMGLAPMSVLGDFQRKGIGSLLVNAGIRALRERNCPFIIVLGHPEYYPRFGFVPASRHGLFSQWRDVPDDAFMVLILHDQAMAGVSGTARYRDEFETAV